ncbi:MAG TPA: outer membrane beta-barrel protein, partial [Gemmatimonadales bacterium]|nr:outer membrane beta-barrel protein [Gemmatimonadales bacterium]
PYYEAGVKATWTASSKLTGQFHILNGWQNISETNSDKAMGMRLDYAATPHLALGYTNFLGNEAPDTAPSRLRVFNEVFGLVTSGPLNFWLTLDYGLQRRAPASGNSRWWGGAAIGRLTLSPTTWLSARLERYADPDAVIITTGTANPFRAWGGSLGFDVAPVAGVLWRSEMRGFFAQDPIFPEHASGGFSKRDGFLVTSLALTF